jgi:M6 family metalloprotease-like protein
MLKKFKFFMSSIVIIFVLLLGSNVFAAPICPVPVEFTQPNGDVITVTSYGDEFFSWQEDENGNIITYDEESNSYKYAEIKDNKIISTSHIVGGISLFSAFSHKIQREDMEPLWESAERIDYSRTDVNDGIQLMSVDDETVDKKPLTDQALLTILIEFNDTEIKYGADFWGKQMFCDEPGAISVVNYWKENANGKEIFKPTSTVELQEKVGNSGIVSVENYTDIEYKIKAISDGVVQMYLDTPHPVKTWYNNSFKETDDVVELAMKALESNFDFSAQQPHIVTIFAGYDNLIGVGDGQGQVNGYTSVFGIETSSGINLGRYTVQGERLNENVPAGIGVICHELGHSVFGLPDLYFANSNASWTTGIFHYSLMSSGGRGKRYTPNDYNQENDCGDSYDAYEGHVPAHLDPWCKIKCGFVTPTLVEDWEGNINSISDIENERQYNIIKVQSKADTKQYFLIENRQLVGFDKGLEALDVEHNKRVFNGGILIYHIDENVGYKNNNNTNRHRFISIERCGHGYTRKYAPSMWPYSFEDGENILNSKTDPNSNFYAPASKTDKCLKDEDCHPKTVESGISVEVLDDSSPSMRVKISIDDKYKIKTGETFSEAFPDINFCNAVIDILEQDDSIERNPNDVISEEDWSKLLLTETLSLLNRDIEDLEGIQHFSKLRNFSCSGNKLTQLNLSGNPMLRTVYCSNNQLTELDVSGCVNIEFLRCNGNKLTKLDISDCKKLQQFYCHNNLLKELDLSKNMGVSDLRCYDNQLTHLNLKNNVWLRILHCYDNYMNENYELSIEKSTTFDEAFNSGQSTNFKYPPQHTVAEPSPTPTPKTGDRVELEQTGNVVTATLIFEETKPPKQDDIWIIVAYKKDGVLKSAEVPQLVDMTASFIIPKAFEDCEISAYVWDKDMKSIMGVQKIK